MTSHLADSEEIVPPLHHFTFIYLFIYLTTPYLLRKNCQLASYHWAGSQLISSTGYGYFEGPNRFFSGFCLRFSES